MVRTFTTALERLDRFRRSRPVLAFPVGVVKKSQDDRAGSLAALIAYYGFFSLFPLLLAFVTVTSFVIRGKVFDNKGTTRMFFNTSA